VDTVIRERISKALLIKLANFAVAGGMGFIIDATILLLLIEHTPLGPYSARVFSIAAAMLTTWAINRTVTFGKSDRPVVKEGARYAFIAIIGAVLNYAIYSGLLLAAPPLMALVIAVAIVTVFSYLGYSRFVFNRE
jgi:putative flippase GtrA